MDILKPIRFTVERLFDNGGWAYLADIVMQKSVDTTPELPPAIPPPPNGSNSWVRPRDPVEDGWESYNVSEAA